MKEPAKSKALAREVVHYNRNIFTAGVPSGKSECEILLSSSEVAIRARSCRLLPSLVSSLQCGVLGRAVKIFTPWRSFVSNCWSPIHLHRGMSHRTFISVSGGRECKDGRVFLAEQRLDVATCAGLCMSLAGLIVLSDSVPFGFPYHVLCCAQSRLRAFLKQHSSSSRQLHIPQRPSAAAPS
ncbi:unnamed protein product, partial [Phaeothamnion confervicola]